MFFGYKYVETGPNCSHELATFLKYHMSLITETNQKIMRICRFNKLWANCFCLYNYLLQDVRKMKIIREKWSWVQNEKLKTTFHREVN